MHPIIVDIETVPHPCAAEFLEPLNLDGITAAKNLKDPAKIESDIRQRKADAEAEHVAKLARASLDWNLSRIVAIGWSVDVGSTVTAITCRDEAEETAALEAFWYACRNRPTLLGFCTRTFDLPTLIQRSRLLSITYPDISLARFGKGDVIDLRDLLTFEDARYEAVMPRSLKMFARRFGIPVEDLINGSDIAQLVADGQWDAVEQHVTSDVRLTAALAVRIGALSTEAISAF